MACRILNQDASAADAHSACWSTGRSSGTAALVPMSELVAGDLVLAEKGGALHIERVVVNQHRETSVQVSALLTLVHAAGSLVVTPDHLVWLDGSFAPARTATVGATLSNGLTVEAIEKHSGGVVNPITAGGAILASDKAGGGPVLAATGNEWLADVLLSAYPKYTLSFALAAALPTMVQAYYDTALEALFNAAVPHLAKLKAAAPPPLVGLALVTGDVALAAGLGTYALGHKGAVSLATAAALAAVAARK